MLITETITIAGKAYLHNYSDAGMQIERDGVLYDDAIDPLDSGRVYTESTVEIKQLELTAEEALRILTGGAADET